MPGALTAMAVLTAAGTTESGLWLAYVAADRVAQASEAKWREAVLAGGRSAAMGTWYRQAYIDRLAASDAYNAWLTAQKV